VLADFFACELVDDDPRFRFNIRCWKIIMRRQVHSNEARNAHRNVLNLAFSPTKQIPTLSGRSAVVKPCCLAKSRTSGFLR